MPIYEYECKNCGQTHEELQSFSDPPLKKCPHCKKNKLEKIISLSSFQLTGTGWYATDYAKGPGIPSQAQDQGNPAIDSDKSTSDSASSSDSKSTVAESGPSSASDTFKSIEKETKKAKSKKKK